jgi:hypothetical protein
MFLSNGRFAGLAIGLFGFFGLHFSHARAATINANSPSLVDVSAAVALAVNGDIVIIPAGTASWTRGLNITKAITIQGAGVGSTIIQDNASGQLILWDYSALSNARPRLTGIEFQDGGRSTTANAPAGIVRISGSNTNGSQFRMDHCKWGNLNGYIVFDTVLGVVDHTSFVSGNHLNCIYIYGTHWNGGIYGDSSWTDPANFGSSNFLFFEDDDFHNNNATYMSYITDALNGARYVVRYSTVYNAFFTDHGTESGGRERGARAMEIYNNTFTGTNIGDAIGGSRSSRVVVHDNTVSGFINGGKFTLGNWRNFYPFTPWGGADGTNQWDKNDPAGAFYTGTANGPNSGLSVTVSGSPGWTTNQWVGYTVRRTTNLGSSSSVTFSWITGNNSNTLNYTNQGGYGGPGNLTFANGDTVEIRKVTHALDQPGWGQGSLITGDPPNLPSGWNNQVSEPCYEWNNGSVAFGAGTGMHSGDYVDGTALPGYTPYVHPHPLVSGQGSPAPPQNLHVTQ